MACRIRSGVVDNCLLRDDTRRSLGRRSRQPAKATTIRCLATLENLRMIEPNPFRRKAGIVSRFAGSSPITDRMDVARSGVMKTPVVICWSVCRGKLDG